MRKEPPESYSTIIEQGHSPTNDLLMMRYLAPYLAGLLLSTLHPAHRAHFVDVGCNSGWLLTIVSFPGVGVDIAPAVLRRAAGKGLAVVRADAASLPFQ